MRDGSHDKPTSPDAASDGSITTCDLNLSLTGGGLKASPKGEGGLPAADLPRIRAASPRSEHQQLVAAVSKFYQDDLGRISPRWIVAGSNPAQSPVDVAETIGVPGAILGAILAGKCRDQGIPVTAERQKRFTEWILSNCSSLWFNFNDAGAGPECTRGIVIALTLNDRFTSLNLSCNSIGDAGAAAIARMLPEHETLLNLDLSANDINSGGVNSLMEGLLRNSSVTYLDLSSKPGGIRNRMGRNNADALERLLVSNAVLARLSLQGTCLGSECLSSLSRGLTANRTLLSLDLAGNDLGAKGMTVLSEALDICNLEDLNLSDTKLGDEGLMVLGSKLGALPQTLEAAGNSEAWTKSGEGIKDSVKYHEAVVTLRRSVVEFSWNTLVSKEQAVREDSLARIAQSAAQLTASLEQASLPRSRLRVLSLAGNGATVAGLGCVEDALQTNSAIERLVLDQNEHRGASSGTKSLIVALPVNTTLKHLSLCQCRLTSAGMVELAKALAANRTLTSLSLRGNQCGAEAAAAFGAVLSAGAAALRQLNLSSCHIDDPAGVALAGGLATNMTLETLLLRDNGLREAAGAALVEALRKQTTLTQLSLELNSIDFRQLVQAKQLLERNGRLREKARPQQYDQRIKELLGCKEQVQVLTATLKRNLVRKRQARIKQAALVQELKDAHVEEQQKQAELDRQLAVVQGNRKRLDEEIATVQTKLHGVITEGDYEASQLQLRINNVEDRIKQHERYISRTRAQLTEFESRASDELSKFGEELERAEKAWGSAQLLSAAAHRNLDNFASSLKAIEKDIAGGAEPRQRMVEVKPPEGGPGAGRSEGAKLRRPTAAQGNAGARQTVVPGAQHRQHQHRQVKRATAH